MILRLNRVERALIYTYKVSKDLIGVFEIIVFLLGDSFVQINQCFFHCLYGWFGIKAEFCFSLCNIKILLQSGKQANVFYRKLGRFAVNLARKLDEPRYYVQHRLRKSDRKFYF